ncbi:hypothetical protein HF295_04530 [Hujiaoplasma nucleasis]|uniref:Major tropism determinant N-terminal domain-containing protein n=1 Tax=Hujiaoplasma nucleasis TaxID=2725268 RepID=A0A7L6N1M3_9MOLU|nr:hypothetical protein [Hujiaoplasma nucleasis]QLY40166.1 hypothetical protein HF295_04530 [Hujiaoplasma nucleasis]
MATIQIKRRTTSGTGPLTGSSGSIKAGEPQVDFNGEHLYIAKGDKTGNSSNPLAESDYLKIPGVGKVNNQIDTKITALNLGTASTKNTGTSSGNIPVLNSSGKLADSIVPKIAMTNTYVVSSQSAMLALSNAQEGDVAIRTDKNKSYILKNSSYNNLASWQELLSPTDAVSSVNGQTGAVTISLAGLGGVSNATFNAHKGNVSHLTDIQRNTLNTIADARIYESTGTSLATSPTNYANKAIYKGLVMYPVIDSDYTPKRITYQLGIDETKVLQPTSVIDGGTY